MEPEDGLYLGAGLYERRVAKLLLDPPAYPTCQVVMLPSFQPETAVFMVRDRKQSASDKIIATEIASGLYRAMTVELEKGRRNGSYLETEVSIRAALDKVRPTVLRSEADIDSATANLLVQVCRRVLSRVGYTDPPRIGFDGQMYHLVQCEPKVGCRSGRTWSPPQGSTAYDFVQLALEMQRFARAKSSAERSAARVRMITEAHALLSRR
ncbi:MAG: hypothetical protein ACHQ17_09445 [Polyangia bacterium]